MLEALSFCDRERAQTPSIKITVLTCNKTFQAYYFLRRGKKNLWVVHAHKSKGLYFRMAPCERNSSLIKAVQYLSCEEAAWNQRQEILLSCKYSPLTSLHAVGSGHFLATESDERRLYLQWNSIHPILSPSGNKQNWRMIIWAYSRNLLVQGLAFTIQL